MIHVHQWKTKNSVFDKKSTQFYEYYGMQWDKNSEFRLIFDFQMVWDPMENPTNNGIPRLMGWYGMGLRKPSHAQHWA